MFEKTKAAFINLDTVYQDAVATKQKTMKYIHENYNGSLQTEKLNEMNALYEETIMKAKQPAIEAVTAEFAAAREVINKIVVADIPESFASDVKAIETRRDSLSDFEIKSYFEKYADCYPALAAIFKLLEKTPFVNKHVEITKFADVIEYLDKKEEEIIRLAKNYKSGLYEALVLVHDTGVLNQLETVFADIAAGNFYEVHEGIIR